MRYLYWVKGQNCMRIKFSYVSEDQIKEGAKCLAFLWGPRFDS